jgi:histo-blood group ABO system transferase
MGKNMKTAFVIIATGTAYARYAQNLVASIREHLWFDPQVFIFTDHVQALQKVAKCFYTDPLGYPKQTLMRYHTILSKEHILEKYDQLFYLDADMLFVNQVNFDDIASDELTATLHPGFFVNNTQGTTEKRKESTAFCDYNVSYYCGGFQGGNTKAYLAVAKTMAGRIDEDLENGIMAVWHDESHWNKYLADAPPAKTLSPSYCYPEDYDGGYGWDGTIYSPILVAMDKRKRGNHPRFQ